MVVTANVPMAVAMPVAVAMTPVQLTVADAAAVAVTVVHRGDQSAFGSGRDAALRGERRSRRGRESGGRRNGRGQREFLQHGYSPFCHIELHLELHIEIGPGLSAAGSPN